MLKLLLVDDNSDIAAGYEGFFEPIDFVEFYGFKDPEDAISFSENNEVDVIITDICMPFMDGFELVEKIRSSNPKKTVPAIYISGNLDMLKNKDEDDNEYFFSKPVNMRKIYTILKTFYEKG